MSRVFSYLSPVVGTSPRRSRLVAVLGRLLGLFSDLDRVIGDFVAWGPDVVRALQFDVPVARGGDDAFEGSVELLTGREIVSTVGGLWSCHCRRFVPVFGDRDTRIKAVLMYPLIQATAPVERRVNYEGERKRRDRLLRETREVTRIRTVYH